MCTNCRITEGPTGAAPEDDEVLLARLLADPTAVSNVPFERVPALLVRVAAVLIALASRTNGPAPASLPEQPDELLTVEEAAKRARCSKDWVYRHWREVPGAGRAGRHIVIPASGLHHLIREPLR